jgi:HD superfamily phosphohydrolase
MQINDRVYGQIEINNQVILDLINSKPFQRLKGINQSGAANYFQPIRNVTRYEHSIGTWYLAYKFERSIEEQIACLLHDIPHTAFSHVIDIVMNDEKHEFHDEFFEKIIVESEIPSILEKNNIKLDEILNKENFPLLDNELPDVSIDRLDYFLRDGISVGFLPQSIALNILGEIAVKDSTFYFKTNDTAALSCILFREFSRLIWLDPISHGGFYILADILKTALKLGIITEEDFWLTDKEVMNKIENSRNKELVEKLNLLSPSTNMLYAEKEAADYYGSNKPRCIDPLFLKNGELTRITDEVISLKYANEEFIKNYKNLGVKIQGSNL